MTVAKESAIRYVLYVAVLYLISLGLERKLLFWEWYFGLGWWRFILSPLWLASVAAAAGICVGTLQLFMFRSLPIRILVFLYTVICLGFVFFFLLLQDRMPQLNDVLITFDGLADFMAIGITIFQTYPLQIIVVLAAAGVFAVALALLGNRAAKLPKPPVTPLLAMAFFLAGMAFYLFVPTMAFTAPVYAKTPVLIGYGLARTERRYAGPRAEPVLDANAADAVTSHIVFIMDESIAGYALGINGFPFDTTPYLRGLDDGNFHNYGITSSSGNYSSVSNLIVTSGLRVDQIPDYGSIALRQASIFGYAKHAGRKAYYVDAQNSKPMNYLSERDFGSMEFIALRNRQDEVDEAFLDRNGLAKMADILERTDQPVFVFFLKNGAHPPYFARFPRDVEYRNLDAPLENSRSYLFAVRWAVDDFFKELAAKLAGKDVIVVYTSDHGQNLSFVNDKDSFRTLKFGSNINPDSREANVPLFIWPMSGKAAREFARIGGYRPGNFNKATHFQIFPTLLRFMGYDPDATERHFGASLFDAPPEKRYFTTLYIDIRGAESQTKWLFEFDAAAGRE